MSTVFLPAPTPFTHVWGYIKYRQFTKPFFTCNLSCDLTKKHGRDVVSTLHRTGNDSSVFTGSWSTSCVDVEGQWGLSERWRPLIVFFHPLCSLDWMSCNKAVILNSGKRHGVIWRSRTQVPPSPL